jgi:hypothetical protein
MDLQRRKKLLVPQFIHRRAAPPESHDSSMEFLLLTMPFLTNPL